ncbi:hypothetical protein VMCG_05020 [Cytospora schulzeri]|uniref:RING-type domain-containing protein n=1 Tax=Cytospora schulzeri TaxID=448051 RepID=A0A423WM36_9PEZI|nr:hypothetical protein VMCG_05020 [Valsa malicola]
MTALQVTQDTGHTQVVKQESQFPPQVSEHLFHDDDVSSSKVNEEPGDPETVASMREMGAEPDSHKAVGSSNVDEEHRNHEVHVTDIAALHSREAQCPSDVCLTPKQAPEVARNHSSPVVTTPTAKDKMQLGEKKEAGKKPSNDLARNRAVMLQEYEKLVDEEAEIEQRQGQPSEKPNDKTRLPLVKQEMERIEEALDQNQVLEEFNTAEESEALQNAMGNSLHTLRVNSTKKSTSTRKTAVPAAKKRKNQPRNSAGSSKKRKLNQTQQKKVKTDDAVAKYLFDQIGGKGTAATTNKNLKKTLPTLRNLGKVKSEYLKKLQAAVALIKNLDSDTKIAIEVDIALLFSKAKVFGKSCTLKLVQGDDDSDKDKLINDYGWAIEGMASALRHHQLIAAGFMIDVEQSGNYSGGLLFDYMGYGKTVESLALIVGNPAKKASKGSRVATTLVVVPTAAASQWVDEVKLHCPGLLVTPWTKYAELEVLVASRVLIVTYAELRVVYKEALGVKKREKKKEQKGGEETPKPVLKHRLFDTEFHRIILDEMHEIKGYQNITCDAVMALKAEYRWGLTGTPTPNGIEELYPYLNFIRHPKITSMRGFKKMYVGGRVRNVISETDRFERLRELLAPVMIMRTPSHSFLGTTLLQLPQAHPQPPIKVKSLPEEKIIYNYIVENLQRHIEKKAADKKLEVNINMVNESFVRQRQCIASPLLLSNLASEGFWCADCIDSMRQEAQQAGCLTTPFIDQLERWSPRSKLGHASTTPGMKSSEQSIKEAIAVLDKATCPGLECCKPIAQLIEPQKAECGHVWCKDCLENQIKFQKMVLNKEIPGCSRCKKALGQAKPFSAAEPAGGETAEHKDQDSTSLQKMGEDYNGKKPRDSNLVDLLSRDPTAKVPRSAKVDAVIRQIVEWQNEAPEDKIIVFIQWIDLNIILGRILQEEGINFLYYAATTEMKEKDRRHAIDTFKQDPFVKVLICSLRCGGQALNLTCANRTIMVDLWWNHSVEAQAMARVYRMGQQKETYFVRVIVEDSIDEHIFELQETKLKNLQNAYQEFEADKNLDMETLIELSNWKTGENGIRCEDDSNNDEYDKEECDDKDLDDKDSSGEFIP